MSESNLKPRMVRIDVDQGATGLFYATSPDITGLLVAERSPAELEAAIPGAISDLYAACGEDVVVIRLDPHGLQNHQSWIKLPAQVAQMALDRMAERRAE